MDTVVRLIARLGIGIVVILCFSCAPIDPSVSATIEALQTHPPPTPEFVIEGHRAAHITAGSDVCLSIYQRPITEPDFNISVDDATDHILDTIVFTIDGHVIPQSDVLSTVNAMAYPIFDENREVIGLFGGTITSCALTTNLSTGLHLVTVDFATIWSREYSYSWVLAIE